MARIKAVSKEAATGKTADMYQAIHGMLGTIPNMMQTMAASPALLEGYLGLSGALRHGVLDGKTGELIALTVSQTNECDYCLSAHTYIGANLMKMDATVMADAQQGHNANTKTAAILTLAQQLVKQQGRITETTLQTAKTAGITDAEIAEVIGHVALNVLTNYFNNTVETEIDFPLVSATQVAVV